MPSAASSYHIVIRELQSWAVRRVSQKRGPVFFWDPTSFVGPTSRARSPKTGWVEKNEGAPCPSTPKGLLDCSFQRQGEEELQFQVYNPFTANYVVHQAGVVYGFVFCFSWGMGGLLKFPQ